MSNVPTAPKFWIGVVILGVAFLSVIAYAMYVNPHEAHPLLVDKGILAIIGSLLTGGGYLVMTGRRG